MALTTGTGLFAGASPAHAEPYTVTVTPSTDLRDGQLIKITIKTTADFPIYAAEARVCRSGVTYQDSSGARPNADFAADGPNCPLTPISSFADPSVVSNNTYASAQTPEGETMPLHVGQGKVDWTAPAGPATLSCDAANPCSLVIQLQGGAPNQAPIWHPVVQPLTYRNADAVGSCGGAATGQLSSGGPDRLTDAWVEWTVAECTKRTGGAATLGTFKSEGDGLSGYNDGVNDLAYTAFGYNDEANVVPKDSTKPNDGRRPSVHVPLALNAVVLAVGNGQRGTNGHKVPYTDIKLTLDEAATLLSGGQYNLDSRLPAIYARNPELAATGFFNTNAEMKVGAWADADATSFFATRHLRSLRSGSWVVPNLPGIFGADAGKARGVDASLSAAKPEFSKNVNLLPGRPSLSKALFGLGGSDFGGIWVLTDLETAKAEDLTVVKLENAAGEFVEPTSASMAAAAATMVPDANGLLQPAPSATGGAYPLTFVEYALAPKEQLVTTEGCLRADSQKLLTDWLTYVTGPGQQIMPAGLVPLTSSLAAESTAKIKDIGSAQAPTPPETCAATTPGGGPNETGDPADGPGGGDSLDSGDSGSPGDESALDDSTDIDDSSGSSSGDANGSASGSPGGPGGGADGAGKGADPTLVATTFPGFFGNDAANALTIVVGLLGVAGLVTMAVLKTAGWQAPWSRDGGPS